MTPTTPRRLARWRCTMPLTAALGAVVSCGQPTASGAPPVGLAAVQTVALRSVSALAANPTASSTLLPYLAARATDGDANTEWQAAGSPAPWLQLDLGARAGLTGVTIKAKPGQPFDIQVGDDAAAFRTVLTASTTTWGLEAKALPAGTAGRYLRIAYHAAAANVMVFELQPMLAAAPAATPTPLPVASPTPPGATPTPAAPPTPLPTAAPTAAPPPHAGLATRFGNQSVPRAADGSLTRGYALLSELGMSTIREGWNWQNLETGDRQYVSWMSYFDGKAAHLAGQGVQEQALVCDTPAWASTNGTRYGVPKGLALPIFADGTDVYKAGVATNPANPFAGYMATLATRYRGQIADYQVWNEPDFPSGDQGAGTVGSNGATRFWDGSVADYVRLLKVAATVVRGLDPAAKISLGGLGYEGYLAAIIDQGGAPYFDVVDFHAYGTDKTSSNGVLNSAWGFLGRYHAMAGVLASKGVTGKPFACSETGFTANNQPEQANYAAKVFATGLGLGDVARVQWAVFTNPGSSSIGLIDAATLSVKTQGYGAFAAATRQLAGCVSLGPVAGTGVQGYRFLRPDGRSLAVAWASGTAASWTPPFAASQVLDVQGNTRAGGPAGALALTVAPVYVIGN